MSIYDMSPEQLIQLVNQNASISQQIKNGDPELSSAISSNNVSTIRLVLMRRQMNKFKAEFEYKQEIAKIEADPTNEENQAKIAEQIRLQNIKANMELAMEELPEAFGSVVMLYVDIEINDTPIKAFVDSGAQTTIMSASCAERCNIMRLLDVQFSGEARGVGTSKILGRIHIAQLKIGSSYFPISITVLENEDIDFLLGLDMLKRYQCCIDLHSNTLRFGGHAEVPFLSEKDLPKRAFGSEASKQKKVSPETKMDTSTTSSSSSSNSANVAIDPDNADKLVKLMSLGFSDVECQNALMEAGGNEDIAASILFNTMT